MDTLSLMRSAALLLAAAFLATKAAPVRAQCCNDACPAPNYPTNGLGVHASRYFDTGGFDIIANAGFKWIRIQILWRATEPGENLYDWSQVDTRLPLVYQRGLSTLVYIHSVPAWANGNQGATTPPNAAHANAYGDFITQLINHPIPALNGRRVGEVAAAFELWNEPNLSDFWTGSADTFKARILAPGINAIQAARQQHHYSPAYIIAPSVYSNTDKGKPVDIGTWVSGYVADLDFVSLHTYGSESAQLGELDAANSWCNQNINCLGFWMTEGGFETYGCGQANCSSAPGAALLHTQNRCINRIWCYMNFIFNLYDVENDSGLVNNQDLVRNRLCYLEENYGSPLAVVPPCPCGPGVPGCANQP